MNDFVSHLIRQAVFSRATFGPGPRTEGVLDHIEKEIKEVRKELDLLNKKDSGSAGYHSVAKEQVDLVILSLDGLLRSIWAIYPNAPASQVAKQVHDMIVSKQEKNELRNWPDWRTAPVGKAIEHVRGTHD